jgi:hypothetical protein
VHNVTRPTLTVYLHARPVPNGVAVVIAPGGAFRVLAIDHEGMDRAKWFAARRVTAFVPKYRLKPSEAGDQNAESRAAGPRGTLDSENAPYMPLSLADGAAALTWVRTHAGDSACVQTALSSPVREANRIRRAETRAPASS